MNRLDRLQRGISRADAILEIGPYFNPIAPRAAGFRTTTLDVFDAAELRRKAAGDPNIPAERIAEIEDVDLVGSAGDLADLTAARYGADHRFDWILSSHNIEHVPDPVRFLAQCAAVLRPGGTLRLAVPDKRFCFDHFRPLTDTSEWLEAFFERRPRPTGWQVFREETLRSAQLADGSGWTPVRRGLELYREWFGPGGAVPDHYMDTHCWAFTPESFELIVRDTIAFGLVDLAIESVSEPYGHEFFADLVRPATRAAVVEAEYYATRERLLRRCVDDAPAGQSLPFPTSRRRSVPQKVLREVSRVVDQLRSLGRAAS